MLAISPIDKNGFHISEPHGWEHKSNRSLGVPTPVLISYLADHLHLSGSKVQDHLRHIVEVKIEVTKVGAFLRKVLHGVVRLLAPESMTCVCGEDRVLILFFRGMVRKCIEMGIFPVLRRMQCNPILALQAITR